MPKILGIQKLTLLDYPGHIAADIFLGGCNFRCPFCQNSPLVLAPALQPEYPMEDFIRFLKKRQGILDGICVTGGEPTLHADLPELLETIRGLGYLVKLDTNGTNPDMLQKLLEEEMLDYAAMDIKAGRENYDAVAGLTSCETQSAQKLLDAVERSAQLLMHSQIPYEFRTTAVKGLHTINDFEDIADWLGGCKDYYLQSFRDCDQILQPNHSFDAFSKKELTKFLHVLQKNTPRKTARSILN